MSDGKKYLNFVIEKLENRLEEVQHSIQEGQKEIEGMQEYYWENYTEMDQYGYENFDNQQALLHQVNANQEQQALKHRLKTMLDAPFLEGWISVMTATKSRSIFILALEILENRQAMCL